MPSLTHLLKVSVIGFFTVTGLAACHPTYVRESYQESYVSAYRPTSYYSPAPSYSVHYYSSAPIVERTIVVPRVIVTQPREAYSEAHRNHVGGRTLNGSDRGNENTRPEHSGRVGGNPSLVQVTQHGRNEVSQSMVARSPEKDQGRARSSDRTNRKGKDDDGYRTQPQVR